MVRLQATHLTYSYTMRSSINAHARSYKLFVFIEDHKVCTLKHCASLNTIPHNQHIHTPYPPPPSHTITITTTMISPLCLPSLFRFPKDRTTLSVDDQFLWGTGFMVSPVLQEGQVKRDVYFPQDNWFDYYTVRSLYIPSVHILSCIWVGKL